MKPDSLTDPTSLIAYRLAHGEIPRHVKRSTGDAPRRTHIGFAAMVGVGLLLAAVTLIHL